MLAVDTNVLVRYLTRDHPGQSPRARDLISDNDIWVAVTVVLETECVLRSGYRFAPADFADALCALAGLPRLQLQHPAEVAQALTLHRRGMDFADALHLMLREGCAEFLTFDRRLARLAGRVGQPVRAL